MSIVIRAVTIWQTVMQKNRVKALYQDWKSLKQVTNWFRDNNNNYYYYLFLEQNLAFLGGQVEKDALVVGLALFVDAPQRRVGVVAVHHAVDMCAYHMTLLRQRVEQLL